MHDVDFQECLVRYISKQMCVFLNLSDKSGFLVFVIFFYTYMYVKTELNFCEKGMRINEHLFNMNIK